MVIEHLCYFPDIMPTLAELAGVRGPESTDGISILPTLIGEKQAGRKQRAGPPALDVFSALGLARAVAASYAIE